MVYGRIWRCWSMVEVALSKRKIPVVLRGCVDDVGVAVIGALSNFETARKLLYGPGKPAGRVCEL